MRGKTFNMCEWVMSGFDFDFDWMMTSLEVFFQTIDWQSKTKANKSLPNDTTNDQRKKFKPQTFNTLCM